MDITTPGLFKSLMMALMSMISPGMRYGFCFTAFLDKGSSSGFYLVFSIIMAFTSQVREPMWGFCQVLSIPIPILYSGTGEITAGWVQKPTGLIVMGLS